MQRAQSQWKWLSQQKWLWLAPVFAGSVGCSSLFGDKTPAEPTAEVKAETERKQQPAKAAKLKDEQELKLARLWARVDELEEEQMRSKERLAIVEKGLTLGIMPEELRRPEQAKKNRKPTGAGKDHKEGPAANAEKGEKAAAGGDGHVEDPADEPEQAQVNAKDPHGAKEPGHEAAKEAGHGKDVATPSGLSKEDADAYQKALANAHDQFRAGRYGRAIVEYSDIGKRFGDDVGGGMHLYWTAKSWANLKEYNTARQQLTEFLKDHASSPWVPRAKFELGRVEWQLGMQETALGRFRDIIQQYPYEDAAEMAKMELQNLDKKL